MKPNLFTLLLTALLFTNCEKDDIEPDHLLGGWDLQRVRVLDMDNNEVHDSQDGSIFLVFEEDASFYRNFVTGQWTLRKKTQAGKKKRTTGSWWTYTTATAWRRRWTGRFFLTSVADA